MRANGSITSRAFVAPNMLCLKPILIFSAAYTRAHPGLEHSGLFQLEKQIIHPNSTAIYKSDLAVFANIVVKRITGD